MIGDRLGLARQRLCGGCLRGAVYVRKTTGYRLEKFYQVTGSVAVRRGTAYTQARLRIPDTLVLVSAQHKPRRLDRTVTERTMPARMRVRMATLATVVFQTLILLHAICATSVAPIQYAMRHGFPGICRPGLPH